ETHGPSGLIHFLYRYYEPSLQRWLTRDPIKEVGGFNIYRFVRNSPTGRYDSFGLREDEGAGTVGSASTPRTQIPCPPDPCLAKGGHYEPYWKAMGYVDVAACGTAEWSLFRDTTAGVLGA